MRTAEKRVPGLGLVDVSQDESLYAELFPADERQQFWMQPTKWPRDAIGMVFLARAAELVGKAMFPDDWVGDELSVNTKLRPLPASVEAASSSDIEKQRQLWINGVHVGQTKISPERWAAARARRDELIAMISPYRARGAKAKSKLVEALLSGRLPYSVRVDETGEFTAPLPPHWWNTDLTEARFAYCQLSTKTPISATAKGEGFRPIFVPEAMLTQLLAELVPGNGPEKKVGEERSQQKPGKGGLSAKRLLIHNAIVALWGSVEAIPAGPIGVTIKNIEKQIEGTHGKHASPSRDTFERYFDDYESSTGYALPGRRK